MSVNQSYVINLTGIKVTIERHGEVTCKARLLMTTTDLPAKASLFNIAQFKWKFGCPSCKHPGEEVCTLFLKVISEGYVYHSYGITTIFK